MSMASNEAVPAAAQYAALPRRSTSSSTVQSAARRAPTPSQARLDASLTDQSFDLQHLTRQVSADPSLASETVLYLGYGSNLAAETFRGKRQIRPISQLNIVAPAIKLTFDLPGMPYKEPCFGNCAYREVEKAGEYHKDHWPKGLVGVVYEVTKKDFAHIIATEGGGSGYQDVLVDCYPLSSNPKDKVPAIPETATFKAHTLFAPINIEGREHAYAQPSARYLKLITDGAAECGLPYEYQDYLHQIRPYHTTTVKQQLGLFVFLSVWGPLFLFIFRGAAAIFIRPDGTFPPWFARLTRAMFTAVWASYDNFFKPMFGDGERTIGDTKDNSNDFLDEKAPLVRESVQKYGIGGRLENV